MNRPAHAALGVLLAIACRAGAEDGPAYPDAVDAYLATLRSIDTLAFTQINKEFDPASNAYGIVGSKQRWSIKRRKVVEPGKAAAYQYDFRMEYLEKDDKGAFSVAETEVGAADGVFRLSRQDSTLHIYKADARAASCVRARERTAFAAPVICAPFLPLLHDEQSAKDGSLVRFTLLLADKTDRFAIRKAIVGNDTYKEPEVGSFDRTLIGRRYWSVRFPLYEDQKPNPTATIQAFTRTFTGKIPVVDVFRGARGGVIAYRAFPAKGGAPVVLAAALSAAATEEPDQRIAYLEDVVIDDAISDAVFAIDPSEAKAIHDHATNMSVEP